MQPLLAHCHQGLGQLLSETGDSVSGLDHVASANAMFGRMGMRFWLERVGKEPGSAA